MQSMRRDWIKEGKPVEKERDEEHRGLAPHPPHASLDPTEVSFGPEGRNGSEKDKEAAERNLHATTATTNGNADAARRKPAGDESLFFSDDEADIQSQISKNKAPEQRKADDFDDFDDLDALMAESFERPASTTADLRTSAIPHDVPPEDDLDALLAEDAARATSVSAKPGNPAAAPPRDDFEDEMEAMADMDMDMDMGGGTW